MQYLLLDTLNRYVKKLLAIFFTLVLHFSAFNIALAKEGGGIQGGGGSFSDSAFWHITEFTIKPYLNNKNISNNLSTNDLKAVLEKMNSKITRLEFTNELLYLKDSQGNKKRVDAINYPQLGLIKIVLPVWQNYIDRNYEIRHMILHEFLGLAKIDDTNYKISSKFFNPTRRLINFNSNKLDCFVSLKIMEWDGAKFWSSDRGYSFTDELPSPAVKGTIATVCSLLPGRGCIEQNNQWEVKSIKSHTGLDKTQLKPFVGNFSILLDTHLTNEFLSYGSAGAFGKTFYNAPKIATLAQLIYHPEVQKTPIVLGSATAELNESSPWGETKTELNLFNNQFLTALNKHAIEINYNQTLPSGRSLFSSENLWKQINESYHKKGITDTKQIQWSLKNEVFHKFPELFPIHVNLSCELSEK